MQETVTGRACQFEAKVTEWAVGLDRPVEGQSLRCPTSCFGARVAAPTSDVTRRASCRGGPRDRPADSYLEVGRSMVGKAGKRPFTPDMRESGLDREAARAPYRW